MATTESTAAGRKQRGAWYTPDHLVALVVDRTLDADWLDGHLDRDRSGNARRRLRVVDPACGDGRFLLAVAERARHLGVEVLAIGVDVDAAALRAADRALRSAGVAAELHCADALHETGPLDRLEPVDVVVGNPPFLSQLAAGTTRGGASRHGGGPYADAAVEFLARSVDAVGPGGRIGLVLPQSVLASRDAATVRARVDATCRHRWAWWSPTRHFDAEVLVCAIGLERRTGTVRGGTDTPAGGTSWAHVVARAIGVPELPPLSADGTVGDRAHLNANFRDEYYALVPAVDEAAAVTGATAATAAPLVTSGLIDPGRCDWGMRPVRFAKRSFDAPVVHLDRLDDRMRAWAHRKLVPKVLVATQTPVIEAVADVGGAWIPGVPVTAVVPTPPTSVAEIAAVLTSPIASAHAWWCAGGNGMSARTLRIGPDLVASVPWPSGPLDDAIAAAARDDVLGCGTAVTGAFGVDPDHPVVRWWADRIRQDRAGR